MRVQFPGLPFENPYERKVENPGKSSKVGKASFRVSSRGDASGAASVSLGSAGFSESVSMAEKEALLSRLYSVEVQYRSAAGAILGDGGKQRASNILMMLENMLNSYAEQDSSMKELLSFAPSRRGINPEEVSPDQLNSVLTEIISRRNSLLSSLREDMKKYRMSELKKEVAAVNRGAVQVSVRDVERFRQLLKATYEGVSRGEAFRAVSVNKEKVSKILNG